MSWRIVLAAWLDPCPQRIERQLFELLIKAARRCAHDLSHCASSLTSPSRYERQQLQRQFTVRAAVWTRIFYPDSGPKDYRTRLHEEIERLEMLCRKNGIDPNEGDIPF